MSVWLLWVRYLSLQPLRELSVMHTTFWLGAYAIMKSFYFLLLVSWVERKLCSLLSFTSNNSDKDGYLAVPDLNISAEALWPLNSQIRDPKFKKRKKIYIHTHTQTHMKIKSESHSHMSNSL